MESGRTLLFIYGTLKRGGRAHHRLAGQRFVGEAETEPRYRVYDIGPYPGLAAVETQGIAVRGELWDVDQACLASLDEYEEAPELFDRRPVAVQGVSGPVEAYYYNRPIPDGTEFGSFWPLQPAGG